MHVDAHTLAIALAISNLLQFVALFTQYRTIKDGSGLGWWTSGAMAFTLGFICTYLRDAPTLGPLAFIASIALFVSGLALHYVGVQRFLGQEVRGRWLAALCLAVILSVAHFTFGTNDPAVLIAVTFLAIAIISLLIARSLFGNSKTASFASLPLAMIFLVNGVFFAVRGLAAPFGVAVHGIVAPSLQQPSAFLASLVTTSMWTFGFIALTNQRLTEKTREDKERLERIFNTCPDAASITSLGEWLFVEINPAFTSLTGYTRNEVLGRSALDLHLWQDQAERRSFAGRLEEAGSCQGLDAVLLSKEGNLLNCILSASLIDMQGVTHVITMIRDIGERKRTMAALEEANRKLEALSLTDGLTGLANRRCFDEILTREHRRHARLGSYLSLILLDIDHFKLYNDRYGHVEGDYCLRQVARVLDDRARRPADLAARYGGEEFVCILPETDRHGALQVAESIRAGIAELAMPHEMSPIADFVTASLGVVTSRCSNELSVAELVVQADELLYKAKKLGRNQVASDDRNATEREQTLLCAVGMDR